MFRDLDLVKWRDEIKDRLPRSNPGRAIHFKDLNHAQRLMAAQTIGQKPLRAICIMANKPVIPEGIYTQKNQLYFYMTRYLIERISWLCRDLRREVPEGDGSVKIIFSRRGGLSYDDFREYLERLRGANDPAIQINWPTIRIPDIEAHDHSTRAGLQIADIVAASVTAGLEPDPYGNCERRYAEALRPILYRRGRNFLSYGVKIVPAHDQIPLSDEQQRFVQLFRE